jgi:hypothetical protein
MPAQQPRMLPFYFVYLGRAGYSVGVTIDARRLQRTVNN